MTSKPYDTSWNLAGTVPGTTTHKEQAFWTTQVTADLILLMLYMTQGLKN